MDNKTGETISEKCIKFIAIHANSQNQTNWQVTSTMIVYARQKCLIHHTPMGRFPTSDCHALPIDSARLK
jgi:hypothetical protein